MRRQIFCILALFLAAFLFPLANGGDGHQQSEAAAEGKKESPSSPSSCSASGAFFPKWIGSLFRKHKKKREVAEEYTKMAEVVRGEMGLDASGLGQVDFANPTFLHSLIRHGPVLLELMSQNYYRNVLLDEGKLADLRKKQLADIEKEEAKANKEAATCPADENGQEEGEKGKDEKGEKGEEEKREEKGEIVEEEEEEKRALEKAAEFMATLAGHAEEEEAPNGHKEVDMERWKAEKSAKWTSWKGVLSWGWAKSKELSQQRLASKLRTNIEWDVDKRGRRKWKFYAIKRFGANWRRQWWSATFKWLFYYINPWHCIGLNKMAKGIGRWFWSEEKKEAWQYEQKGRQIFDMMCYLNGIGPEEMEKYEKEVGGVKKATEADLDAIIGTLQKFTLSALLIPFKQRPVPKEGKKGEEGDVEKGKKERKKKKKPKKGKKDGEEDEKWQWDLGNVHFEEMLQLKAVLTDQKLLGDIVARIKAKMQEEKGEPGGEHPRGHGTATGRRKRAIGAAVAGGGFGMHFAGLSLSAGTMAAAISSLGLFIVLDLAVVWCLDWFSLPWI